MARFAKTARNTHRMDLCAAARLGPIMRRREAAGLSIVSASVAKAVLWPLVNYGGQDGRAWPSRQTLADEAETSVSTVRRVLEIFVAEGLIRETIQRTRGPAAGRKVEAHDGATNVYVLDYEVLARWAEDDENAAHDEPRTRLAMDRVSEERGSLGNGTRLTENQNAAHLGGCSKEEPNGTVVEPPPNPPRGGEPAEPEVGGQSAEQHAPSTPLQQAREILAAYPRTSSDMPEDDARAAVDAILDEQERPDRPERCTWVEIRSAALAVRAMKPKDPLWARTWFKRRGYLPLVLEARRIAEASSRTTTRTTIDQQTRDLASEDAALDSAISGLSPEQIAELHQRVLDQTASSYEREFLAHANPKKNRLLRARIAQLLATSEAA